MVRRTLVGGLLAAALLARCALLDGAFGPYLQEDEALCASLGQQRAPCSLEHDAEACTAELLCLRFHQLDCSDAWASLVACLQQDHACGEAADFCVDARDAVLVCAGDGELEKGRETLRDCLGGAACERAAQHPAACASGGLGWMTCRCVSTGDAGVSDAAAVD